MLLKKTNNVQPHNRNVNDKTMNGNKPIPIRFNNFFDSIANTIKMKKPKSKTKLK